jgi:hypothetical protein
VWDLETYEIVEGSLSRGEFVIYLSGRKLDGEWTLRRVEANRWCVVNRSARFKCSIPADAPALAGIAVASRLAGGPEVPVEYAHLEAEAGDTAERFTEG